MAEVEMSIRAKKVNIPLNDLELRNPEENNRGEGRSKRGFSSAGTGNQGGNAAGDASVYGG